MNLREDDYIPIESGVCAMLFFHRGQNPKSDFEEIPDITLMSPTQSLDLLERLKHALLECTEAQKRLSKKDRHAFDLYVEEMENAIQTLNRVLSEAMPSDGYIPYDGFC